MAEKNPPSKINITLYGSKNETYEKLCGNPKGYEQAAHAIDLLLEATKKNFKQNKKKLTLKKASAKTTTIKKLKLKKTYYFKVRAYKVVNKKKVYGTWSKVKKIKVKK